MRIVRRFALLAVLLATTALSIYGIGCRSDGDRPLTPSATLDAVKIAIPVGSRVVTDFGDAVATSVRTSTGVSTTLRDPAGTTVLATLVWSYTAGQFTWNVTGVGSTTESTGGQQTSLKGSNYALYMIYNNVQAALRAEKAAPGAEIVAPGCDYFPDILETECILACCQVHDDCWAANNCSLKSWIPFVGSAACKACNRAVVLCIAGCVVDAVIDIIVPD
jgi:hypothetical protein